MQAVQRDLKNYIAKHATRSIPVGYSAADVREILASTWEYLQCAINGTSDDPTRADFFGLNSYSWCGSSATFQSSGYDQLVSQFSNTSIPVFFSEYGCNRDLPRTFDEVQALYGPQMTPVLSGGLVYEFSEEESNYGLVNINPDGSAQLRGDYDHLQQQYSKLDVAKLAAANATATSIQPPACNSSLITYDGFNSSFVIPSIPAGGQDLINNGIPNPNQGKLIDITKTQVGQKVQDSSGKTLNSLMVKLLPNDQSNAPGPASSSSDASSTSSATGTATSASATKKGAAVKQSVDRWLFTASAFVLYVIIFRFDGMS